MVSVRNKRRIGFLDERFTQVEKENMIKNVETKPINKKEMYRLEDKTYVFEGTKPEPFRY